MSTTLKSSVPTQWLVLALTAAAACGEPEVAPPPSLEPPVGSSRLGIFEGKVPCTDCEKIKTRLTLHRSAQDSAPTTYILERIGVGLGNERLVSSGTWTRSVGSRVDSFTPVATLTGGPEGFSHYLMVGNNLLLLLDVNLEPRVGNAVYSYTLSRTE